LLKRNETWDTESGRKVTFTLEGPCTSSTGLQYDQVNLVLAAMPAGYTQWAFDGDVWDVRQNDGGEPAERDEEGGKGRLTVVYQATGSNPDADQDPEVPSDRQGLISLRWTREYTELEWPPSECPTIKAIRRKGNAFDDWISALEAAASAYRTKVKQLLNEATAGETAVDLPTINSYYTMVPQASGYTPEDNAFVSEFFYSLCVNPEVSFEERAPLLRKEMDVAASTSLEAIDAYAGRILSWEALVQHEPTLNTSMAYSAGLDQWSWLVVEANVVQEAFGTYQLTQEYRGVKEWYLYLYGAEVTSAAPVPPAAISSS